MSFTINEITESRLKSLKEGNIWREDCPVHYSRLRSVWIDFIDFDGDQQIGELIVLDEVAESVSQIFMELLGMKFPIQKMIPMEEFNGDDVLSMQENNSSAYNGRKVARTDRWSSHAYGCAIDINPIQNPYLLLDGNKELTEVIPPAGDKFLDRSKQSKGMVEEIVSVFTKYGFTEWGGSWETKPDYHHFQLPWDDIERII